MDVKQARWEQLMELQQGISLERNQAFVGQTLDVLIEGQGDGISSGRSYRDAPEIDGLVLIEGDVPVGEMVPARITGAMTYDLTATVEWGGDSVRIGLSSRSSIGSALAATRDMLKTIADLAGVSIEQPEGYPSWTPNLDSPLLKVMQSIHKEMTGKEAEVKAIHAGLECGLIGEKFPGMDMISFGPDLRHPHSPDEGVRVESLPAFWNLLINALEKMADQAA